jgi:IS5 family transposase
VLHAKALPGNPYDGHTLAAVVEATEKLTGCTIERAYVDNGYRGHETANPRRVFISGQKRGVFGVIERELRRGSAIEAIIGHMKTDGPLGRCYLKGREGDAANAILTTVGHNLRLVLAWLRILLCLIRFALWRALAIPSALKSNGRLNIISNGRQSYRKPHELSKCCIWPPRAAGRGIWDREVPCDNLGDRGHRLSAIP